MSKKVNLSGKRFGSLTAIEPIGKDVHGKTLWSCICDCGGKVIVPYGNLAYGNTNMKVFIKFSLQKCNKFQVDEYNIIVK